MAEETRLDTTKPSFICLFVYFFMFHRVRVGFNPLLRDNANDTVGLFNRTLIFPMFQC